MKEAFIKLHVSIILAGATGIFGKLITLNEGLLVWYRMMFATLLFSIILYFKKELHKIALGDTLKIGGVGLLLGFHWVFFYGSIKASNVSIGVVCFSLTGFFTAFLEPLIYRRRISIREILFSLLTLFGIILIFHFDTRYRLGICLGAISSALAALFTITNKKIGSKHVTSTLLLYEMAGGFIGLSCLLPLYLSYFPVPTIFPDLSDFINLLLLASICTIGLYILQIQVLKTISAFTVNLSYNLEPVYSILLAMLLFNEAKELNISFYIGLSIIILSVILQTGSVFIKDSTTKRKTV
ncbi:DMT family transporter [Butyricimonas hominis]|uniref:DMT family transporter n=1 Tax=Butyricimonas TaxID=574697 RepID=UPI003513A80E